MTCFSDIFPPTRQFPASLFRRYGFFVGDIIDLSAEGIKGAHGILLFLGKQNKRHREIGGAFLGDILADFYVTHQPLCGIRV